MDEEGIASPEYRAGMLFPSRLPAIDEGLSTSTQREAGSRAEKALHFVERVIQNGHERPFCPDVAFASRLA